MKIISSIVTILVLLYVAWFFMVQFGSFDVTSYKGDGQIKPIGKGYIGKGVELVLPNSNLGQTIYSIKDIPITGRDYFVFTDADVESKSSINIGVKVLDKHGNVFKKFDINKSNAISTSLENNIRVFYSIDGYIPKSKVGEVDRITVEQSGITDKTVRIILRSGGNI
jgi:hypothetical protein